MGKPQITGDKVKTLFETKFIKLFDIQYEEGRHYFDATRNEKDNLVAIKSDEEFQNMLPDAVSCFVILKVAGEEPKLLLSYEYRYPVGQFLLSPPAGLLDIKDAESENPVVATTIREIFEETGIVVKETDKVFVVNPLAFSTPGMTDESNALSCAVIELEDLDCLNQDGAEGTECFDGFELLTIEQAKKILMDGRDKNGNFYPIYTWAALMYFISKQWED